MNVLSAKSSGVGMATNTAEAVKLHGRLEKTGRGGKWTWSGLVWVLLEAILV